MKSFISKKSEVRVFIFGVVSTAIGCVSILLNLFNLYGKATACFDKKNCSISANVLIYHIGIAVFITGLALTAFGIVSLIVSSRRNK